MKIIFFINLISWGLFRTKIKIWCFKFLFLLRSSLLFLSLLLSNPVNAADFTIQLIPASNSVGNSEVIPNSLSTSKIINFTSEVISIISSTLSNYFLKSDLIPPTMTICTSLGCTESHFTTTSSGNYVVPNGVKYLKIRMLGGGGGGQGASGLTLSPGIYDLSLTIILAPSGATKVSYVWAGIGSQSQNFDTGVSFPKTKNSLGEYFRISPN